MWIFLFFLFIQFDFINTKEYVDVEGVGLCWSSVRG